MKNGWQNLFLILFALLQCVAPLAHAHVDGIDNDLNAYSHEITASGIHTHEAHLENQLGAVVALTQAAPFSDPLQFDEPSSSLATSADSFAPLLVSVALPRVIQQAQITFSTHRSYSLAHPQAPPSLTF